MRLDDLPGFPIAVDAVRPRVHLAVIQRALKEVITDAGQLPLFVPHQCQVRFVAVQAPDGRDVVAPHERAAA